VTSFTRANVLAAMLGLGALAAAPAARAARNNDAESYVQANAAAALRTLGDRSVPAAQRQRTFNALMAQFADMPRIANFVLGRYGPQLRADPALRAEWTRVFQDYSIAVYEFRLEQYSGSGIRVTGSVERVVGQDVVVSSELMPNGGDRALPVQWRLLRAGEVWKVVDVSLILEGNQIWLAQQQQSEFLVALDRNSGDIRALIANVRGLTDNLRQRIAARG
jgi:phospholipid transport system substrate-binding protein